MRRGDGDPGHSGDPLSAFINEFGRKNQDINDFSQNYDNLINQNANTDSLQEKPIVFRQPYEPYYHATNTVYSRPSHIPSFPITNNIFEQNSPINIETSSDSDSFDLNDIDLFKMQNIRTPTNFQMEIHPSFEISQMKIEREKIIQSQPEIYIENIQKSIEQEPQIHLNHTHSTTEVFDLPPQIEEPVQFEEEEERYFEGHLTSTSDLDLQSVQVRTPTSAKLASPKPHSSEHHHHNSQKQQQQGLIPPPLSIQEMKTPSTLQGIRHHGIYSNVTLKKVPGRPQMTDDFIRNALNQKSAKEAPPQKPLQNCCVAAAMGNSFRPLYTEFGNKEPPKIHWMSFPGLNISPFEKPPTNTEEYIAKQKKKQEAQPNAVENEAIAINYCEICKTRFTDAVAHRASENHIKCARGCNWKELDDLFKDINEKFVKELDS